MDAVALFTFDELSAYLIDTEYHTFIFYNNIYIAHKSCTYFNNTISGMRCFSAHIDETMYNNLEMLKQVCITCDYIESVIDFTSIITYGCQPYVNEMHMALFKFSPTDGYFACKDVFSTVQEFIAYIEIKYPEYIKNDIKIALKND